MCCHGDGSHKRWQLEQVKMYTVSSLYGWTQREKVQQDIMQRWSMVHPRTPIYVLKQLQYYNNTPVAEWGGSPSAGEMGPASSA